jgi:hypothetical protein
VSKALEITIGGKKVLCDLCEEEAPVTVGKLVEACPFESVVFAANVCSNEITWNTPIDDLLGLENVVFQEDPGNVVFYPAWSAICVFFGPTEPVGQCTKVASIRKEYLPVFAEEASKVWFNQGEGNNVTTAIVEED